PSLQAGMDRARVATTLGGIFARLNPAGQGRAPSPAVDTPVAWTQAMHQALANATIQVKRQQAARRAIQLHPGIGPDVRNGFAHYALGRLSMISDPADALAHLHQADAIFASQPDMAIHRAKVAVQLAGFALMNGDGHGVMAAVDPHIRSALAHENARVLASLLLLRHGLDLVGRSSEAQSVRLDGLAWARYGYGGQSAVFDRLNEIQDLNPAH
ncbi:MAG: ATP-dependent transcriptional regulator, partial [Pseudomonadota bacterium]